MQWPIKATCPYEHFISSLNEYYSQVSFFYLAEGGLGGTHSTVGQCTQVPAVGPYTGGFTARISKINSAGVRTTVVDKLPSSQTNAASGSLVSGVADVAFIGN